MSSQSRIQRVVMVNWKGVFFHSFDIDPEMTILEGANGTGKTTIMIAAYTCLMPDLNFLGFQNVTTVSSRRNEDKGLYGRLGQDEKNREEPIFSVLDVLTSSGVRHLVGVQLIKKTYPQIALKHFAVQNLSLDADIEAILLNTDLETRQQVIPELVEIGENCRNHGGELVTFRHAKDYFRFLFENEISPIRLTEHEDRRKYNQLLHTSLYGGLSRSLQSSLRDYLLPENDKLVKGIQEMEQNLLTCRKTRAAIQRYQSVREVIQRVYQTSLDMFSAAFFASRLNAEQHINKALTHRHEKRQLKQQWEDISRKLALLWEEQTGKETDLKEVLSRLDSAREVLTRCQTAQRVAADLAGKEKDLETQQEVEKVEKNRYQELKSAEDQLMEEERELAGQQMALATQLSDSGKAWQDLSRQVGLFQQVQNLLQETNALLGTEEITKENLSDWLETVKGSYENCKDLHEKAYFELNEVQLKQEHFSQYHRILEEIVEEQVEPENAWEKAEEVLEDHFALENRVRLADEYPEKLGKLNEKLRLQQQFKSALSKVGLDQITSSEHYEQERENNLKQTEGLSADLKRLKEEIEEKTKESDVLQKRLPELEKQLSRWEEFQQLKKSLEDRTTRNCSNTIEFADLQSLLEKQLQQLHMDKYELKAKQKQVQYSYNLLINEGANLAGLKRLADQGFGTLLSDKYEDIPGDWASNLESRLGPLTNALVVKDIHKSANDLTSSFDRPDELWLVEESVKEILPEAVEINDSILVKHGDAWRLSRLTEFPTLGKDARAVKQSSLSEEIKSFSQRLEKLEAEIKSTQESQAIAKKLLTLEEFFSGSSPIDQVKTLKDRQPILEKELLEHSATKDRLQERMIDCEEKETIFRQFYPQKELLDDAQIEERLKELNREWEETQALADANREKAPLLKKLQQGKEFLKADLQENLEDLRERERITGVKEEEQRQALDALKRLEKEKESFQYEDQVALLDEKKSLNSHLEEKLKGIEVRLKEIKVKISESSVSLKDAMGQWQLEEAKMNTLKGQIQQLQETLAGYESDGSDEELAEAGETFNMLRGRKEDLESGINGIKEQRYGFEAEIKQVQESRTKAENSYKYQLAKLRPAARKWRRFHQQAKADQKYNRLLADYFGSIKEGKKQPEVFWRKVSGFRATLIAILEKMHDTQAVLERIQAVIAEENDEIDQGEVCVKIWHLINDYLNQVIPVDLQTSDPEKAQERITEKLDNLGQNLEAQEKSLRIHVQSIPSHLNAEIRKQKSRIRKLNQKLENIRFGFLRSIRVHIETQPKLKRFLDILPQQLDIFAEVNEEELSIETLMADLYEKEGAGKVKGDLLLDYRHYVKLSIEVKREGNEAYEKVTSTNLSTGESIGVGIAVLIMVLMSWEEQSTFSLEKETRGSIRFLLLDESSRLDQKALYTLTDFCKQLNLQLLIAAPSVERTLRGTTHHLTRSHYNGREEVIVRGRRITGTIN